MEAKSFDRQIGEEIEAAAQLKECEKCWNAFKQEVLDARQAGMQVVAEFVDTHRPLGFFSSEWRAFLKSEGLLD